MRAERQVGVQAALLVACVLLAWLNALAGPFQFDDYIVIVNNPAVHSLPAWLDAMPGIRPLLKLSYALNWALDDGAFGFHLVNVAVHAANAVLVFLLLRSLDCLRAHGGAAFLAALVFALHPAQTEAVTYVSGRSTSLMALFYLGSLLAYAHADAARAWRGRIVSAALFAAALTVKETAVTLPIALLLIDAVGPGLSWRASARRHALHWGVLVLALAMATLSPTYRHLADVSLATRTITSNLFTQAEAIPWLAGQLVMPWRLNIDPDHVVTTTLTLSVAAKALAILAIALLALASLRRSPWFAFGVLWFLLHLLPTNSVLPRLDVANDRQLYLASLGAWVLAAVVLQSVLRRIGRPGFARAAVTMLALVLGAGTVLRNQDYATQVALWEDTAAKSPGKPRVHNNLGWAYQQEGRHAQARAAYQRALALDPDYWRARINLSTLPEDDDSASPAR